MPSANARSAIVLATFSTRSCARALSARRAAASRSKRPAAVLVRQVRLSSSPSTSAFVRNTAVMAVGTTLSRLTGFLRIAAMAFAIGITETRLADSYNIANTTPNIIYELALGGILSSVLVPVLVEWMQTRGRPAAWEVAQRLFTVVFISLTATALVAILVAPWIIRLYTVRVGAGADEEAIRELATFFLRWFMPQIVFYGVGAVGAALLNADRRFAAPMFAPILNNLIVIATFLVFAAMSPPPAGSHELATGAQELVLAIGTTLGIVAMTVALWPSLRRIGFRFHLRLDWRDPAVSRIAHLAKWTVVYVVANQIGYLFVIVLSGRVEGGYAAYLAAALPKFRTLPGNVGYAMFREDGAAESAFMVVSWWASADAIRAYAGEDISKTRFLPRDPEFLIDPEATVHNYRVERVDPAPP